VDLKDLKAIIDLMKKNSITELELERQEFKVRLKRAGGTQASEDLILQAYPAQALSAPSVPMGTVPLQVVPAPSNDLEIKSPMIGTFYRAASPEAEAFVEIGNEVSPDSVVCIIEAMKVMNEIKAEVKGVITQILVENARPVEFGQPLFKIRPT
jgi:acetyl-CoA carboxylase biotin carboxyl carrier protein